MKERNGFVSNSSSSSFVAVISKEAFDKALEQAKPYTKAVINAMDAEEGIFLGHEVKILGTLDVHGCSNFDYLDIDEDVPESFSKYESFEEFLATIPNDQIVTHSEDF